MPVGGFKRFSREEIRELLDGPTADAIAMRRETQTSRHVC
jgi:hypothetical protein